MMIERVHRRVKDVECQLFDLLHPLAQKIIDPVHHNESFRLNPDSVIEHDTRWHEYGIITHSRKVAAAWEGEAQTYLSAWGFEEIIEKHFQSRIASFTKHDLFSLSIPLHDLGKFCRAVVPDEKGGQVFSFRGHEAMSERLVKSQAEIQRVFDTLAMTSSEREYVARCTGLHFELGTVRDVAYQRGLGFTLNFAASPDAQEAFDKVIATHPDYAVEIGVYFLIDSLGKISGRFSASTDAEREALRPQVNRYLADRGLPPELAGAAIQLPTNLAIARRYLEAALRATR